MKLLRNKKGFTLVEIIVVLVIIAILAAISLPALTGYISDAKEKSAISEGRTAYVAAQTIASELRGMDVAVANIETYLETNTRGTDSGNSKAVPTAYTKSLYSLTGLKAPAPTNFNQITIASNGTVSEFVYGSPKMWVVYNGSEMSVNTDVTAPTLP